MRELKKGYDNGCDCLADWPDDCERIQRILKERGHVATLKDCELLWSEYSDGYNAIWMDMSSLSDDYIYEHITIPQL